MKNKKTAITRDTKTKNRPKYHTHTKQQPWNEEKPNLCSLSRPKTAFYDFITFQRLFRATEAFSTLMLFCVFIILNSIIFFFVNEMTMIEFRYALCLVLIFEALCIAPAVRLKCVNRIQFIDGFKGSIVIHYIISGECIYIVPFALRVATPYRETILHCVHYEPVKRSQKCCEEDEDEERKEKKKKHTPNIAFIIKNNRSIVIHSILDER